MPETIELEIQRPDREPSVFAIEPGVYTVGRDEDCKIHLPHPDVDERHAVLTVRAEGCWVEDLDARTGTYVDGERINGRRELGTGETVGVGPFALTIRGADAIAVPPPPTPAAVLTPAPLPPEPPPPQAAAPQAATADEGGARPPAPDLPPYVAYRQSIKQQIHKQLVERLDLRRLTRSRISHDELRKRAHEAVEAIVAEVRDRLPAGVAPAALIKDICDEALGLGPLEEFLADPDVTEIMVNGYSQIYVEKDGKILPTGTMFMDNSSVLAVIERIVSPLGRRIDESQPYVDARLPDGSRVNAIIHPLSLVGPCLTIRKFAQTPFTDADLIRFGTWTEKATELLRICVQLRKNIVVSGGTGSGKTTLLNVLSNYLPHTDRIVTIEDAAELRLEQDHVVRLEARPANIEGRGAVTIRDLVRNALRMRPDRIVVGECRGEEALDMLQAMNTGHDGSLTTVHANAPRDVISRLETMVLMSGMDLPVRAIREQIASAIDVIVHEARFSDGSRKVTHITEVVGLEGDQITMQDIFVYGQTGVDAEGKVIGAFQATGSVPTFIEDIASRGLTIRREMFMPEQRHV